MDRAKIEQLLERSSGEVKAYLEDVIRRAHQHSESTAAAMKGRGNSSNLVGRSKEDSSAQPMPPRSASPTTTATATTSKVEAIVHKPFEPPTIGKSSRYANSSAAANVFLNAIEWRLFRIAPLEEDLPVRLGGSETEAGSVSLQSDSVVEVASHIQFSKKKFGPGGRESGAGSEQKRSGSADKSPFGTEEEEEGEGQTTETSSTTSTSGNRKIIKQLMNMLSDRVIFSRRRHELTK